MPNNKSMVPSEDQIRERAYEIYLARGCEDGHDLEDWVEAERQFSSEGQRASRTGAAVAGSRD